MAPQQPARPLVVIIEPDVDTADLCVAILQPHYNVALVACGADLQQRLQGAGAIVTELALPIAGGGVGLIALARKQSPRCAVIATTAHNELVPAAFEAGCTSALVKPFDQRVLVRRLKTLLARAANGPLVRPLGAHCPKCYRSGVEAFDHSLSNGVWLMCRGCRHVWLDWDQNTRGPGR